MKTIGNLLFSEILSRKHFTGFFENLKIVTEAYLFVVTIVLEIFLKSLVIFYVLLYINLMLKRCII